MGQVGDEMGQAGSDFDRAGSDMDRPGVGKDRPADASAAIGALADPQRRALLDFVRSAREPVSREAAASALGMQLHRARFHLERLEATGLLESQYVRTSGRSGPGAGRPAKVYRPSVREFAVSVPARGYELAGRLMAAAVAESAATGEAVRPCLERHFTRFGAAAARGEGDGAGPAAREPIDGTGAADPLESLSTTLEPLGYEPDLHADRVELTNCPFHALAQEQTELICGLNHCLVTGLVDALAPGTLDARLEPDPHRCCVVVHRTPPD